MKLLTKNLILRFPSLEDEAALKAFQTRNKEHLSPWESTGASLPNLSQWIKECEEGKSARFLIFSKEKPNLLIGMCNYTQIFHGAFQACYLGYKIDQEYEGKGLMYEALQASIDYIFNQLGLHRIMSNYIPFNLRSAKLLERLGFTKEGYAKKYLKINNQWEDHILTALNAEEWQTRNK